MEFRVALAVNDENLVVCEEVEFKERLVKELMDGVVRGLVDEGTAQNELARASWRGQ